ncbi:MAG: hypothetical protein KJ984_03765 [Nanoarchaeota archaeon]|nr:hypothetical protein [Nanoarchaeota archaeon]
MTLLTEIIIVVLFWLIYGPASIIIWHPGTLIELIAVLGAGIIFTIIFFGSILIYRWRKKRNKKPAKEETVVLEEPEEEEVSEEKESETCSEEVEETSEEEVLVPHVGMLPFPIQEESDREEHDLD